MDKNAIWDRTHPHLHINCSLCVWGRVQGSQIFKQNSIISIRSKVMAFLVILLSPWSPCRPCHPHVIPVSSPSFPGHPHSPHKVPMWSPWLWSPWSPLLSPWSPPHVVPTPCGPRGPHVIHVIPTLSPCHPRHAHIVPIALTRSPCGPHGCGLCGLLCCLRGLHPMLSPPHVVSMVPTLSLSFPHHPCHPHVIPIAPRRFPCGPHGCGLRGLLCCLHGLPPCCPCGPRGPHVIPVSSPSSPHCLEGPHIIPNPPTSSLTPPDTHYTHPPHPPGGRGPQISKNAIRFELIEIF